MGFHGILYGILWGFMLCFKFCVKLSMRIYVILLLIYPPDFSKMAIGNHQWIAFVYHDNHLRGEISGDDRLYTLYNINYIDYVIYYISI